MLKYHFSIFIDIKKYVDVDFIENRLNLKAEKSKHLTDSNNQKSTIVLFQTQSFYDDNFSELLNGFITSLKDTFVKINNLCKEFNGIGTLVINFEKYSLDEKPQVILNDEALKIVLDNNILVTEEYQNN